MADLTSQRRKHVQTSRAVAKAAGSPLIRDDATQDKICAFAAAIAASEVEESEKKKAREAQKGRRHPRMN